MTFTYCDARYDGTPVHRCLCQHQVMHNGAHKCVCGHTWGLDWNHLTYDQQREHLGLTPWPGLADCVRRLGYEQRTHLLDTIRDVYLELACLIPGLADSPLIDQALETHAESLDHLIEERP